MPPILTVVKRQLASLRLSFLITALVMLLATTSADAAAALSRGNYSWLLAVLAPFFLVFYDYSKLLHLGATKRDFYLGSLMCYAGLALLISGTNTGIHLLVDPLNQSQAVVNLMELCGWWANGPLAALFQQFLFLLLAMLFSHVLLSMQANWYGWVADGLLVAVISIFTPIAPLRQILSEFFRLIMINGNAVTHSAACIALIAALAFAGLAVLKRKTL